MRHCHIPLRRRVWFLMQPILLSPGPNDGSPRYQSRYTLLIVYNYSMIANDLINTCLIDYFIFCSPKKMQQRRKRANTSSKTSLSRYTLLIVYNYSMIANDLINTCLIDYFIFCSPKKMQQKRKRAKTSSKTSLLLRLFLQKREGVFRRYLSTN